MTKLALMNKKILEIPKINTLKRDYPNFLSHCSIGIYGSSRIKNFIKQIENNNLENLNSENYWLIGFN